MQAAAAGTAGGGQAATDASCDPLALSHLQHPLCCLGSRQQPNDAQTDLHVLGTVTTPRPGLLKSHRHPAAHSPGRYERHGPGNRQGKQQEQH
jgi:hypothetical protein